MRIAATAAAMLLSAVAMVPVGAVADALDDCRAATSPEARLAACSRLIEDRASPPDQKALAYRFRGRTRVEAGALEAAIADLDAAIRLAPSDSQAFVFRAQARLGRGDVEGAVADYAEVVRLRPRSPVGYSGRGHAHLVKGRAMEAVADFSEAIRLSPASASAHNNRGLAYKAAGDLPRAVEDFTAAVMLNPIYALAYTNRGYAFEAQGRKAEAVADFRSALLLDASITGAREGLVRLGAAGALAEESRRQIEDGRVLVQRHCQGCHAVGADGASPNPRAPTFRSLHQRHAMIALREPLTRGIAAPHDEMPKFRLPDNDIDKIVAYINSLETR
jgi:tetratricopeptide (TPR) repeat protein